MSRDEQPLNVRYINCLDPSQAAGLCYSIVAGTKSVTYEPALRGHPVSYSSFPAMLGCAAEIAHAARQGSLSAGATEHIGDIRSAKW